MAAPVVVEQSRVVPIAVEEAFHGTLPVPLPDICGHWYGPIPPIKEVRDQTGDWGAVGESRTLLMVGGGSVHEELTTVEPPRLFGYRLTDIKGPMSVLVGSVTGAWIFVPMDGGTQITWRWTIHPKSALTAPALPAFGMLWKGYARRVLQKLSTILTG